jgi:hypothetical protein
MRHRIWISFDLGVRGDYTGMYEFLDSQGAKECGDSIGTFWYEFQGDMLKSLTRDLKNAMTIDKRSRVYVIYPRADGKNGGKFLVGSRKAPSWTGHAPSHEDEEDIGE